ncbi:MAG: outer membrane beta-barrel protein [Verrucomicrobiota bacterium]
MNLTEDFDSTIPLTTTIGVGGGWDDNMNTSATSPQESAYMNTGIGAVYGIVHSKTTVVNVGGNFSWIYYFDPAPGLKKSYYDTRGTLNVLHRVSPRLTLVNNSYLAYEIEPDYAIGASGARRTDQYLYGYTRTAAEYAWTRRLATVTGFTLTGIDYKDNPVTSATEDRLTYIVSNQFRYLLDRQTTITQDFRWLHTSYDTLPRDVNNYIVTVGVDHIFSPRLSTSLAVGAEWNRDSVGGNATKPYAEFLLTYRAAEKTTLTWANSLGFDQNEIAAFSNRYSWRSGLTLAHQITPYISGRVAVGFLYSDFDGLSGVTTGTDENSITVSAGLAYRIFDNTDVNVSYHYTNYSSDSLFRDYDRNRVSLGLTATF